VTPGVRGKIQDVRRKTFFFILNLPNPLLKLAVRFRQGSGSMVGIPVADVVVVHVLVDILRKRLGGTKRFPFCKKKNKNKQKNGLNKRSRFTGDATTYNYSK
jgi:hypothetical protein